MSRWAPASLSSGRTSGLLALASSAGGRGLHCSSVRSSVARIGGNNGTLHEGGQAGKQPQQQLRPLCLQLSRFGLHYRQSLFRHYRVHCPSAASYWRQTRGCSVGLSTSAAAFGSSSARDPDLSPSVKAGSDEAAVVAAASAQQQQHSRHRPFEQLWIEARRRPQVQEHLKRDEARFMRDVIMALPQYEPYAVCRSVDSANSTRPGDPDSYARPAKAAEEVVASAIRSLESFAVDRDRQHSDRAAAAGGRSRVSTFARSDWAKAFQCLDAISRLDRADQQRLLLQPGMGALGRPFAALLAFCCRNLQALPTDDYRRLMRSLAGVQWELFPGKAGNQFLHSVEYAQLEEQVAKACGELLDPPTGSSRSVGLPTSAARQMRGSSQRPVVEAAAAGVASPAAVPQSISKLHLAYALMAEHARRMPSWSLVDVAFHSDVFNALLVASSDACLRTYYVVTMAVIERLLLTGGCPDGSKVRVAPPSEPWPTAATAAAGLPTVEALVMTCYLAACCRHAPRSLMQLVEGAVRRHWRDVQPLERAVVALGFFKSQNKFGSRQLVCGMFDTARAVASGAIRLPSSAVGDPTYVVSSLVKQCAYSVDRVQVALHETLRAAMLRCYAAVVPVSPMATSVRCVQSMIVTRQVVWPTVEAFVSSLAVQPSQPLVGARTAGRSEAKAKSSYDEELEEEGGQRMKDLAVILFVLGSLQYRAAGSDDLYKRLLADLTSPERLCELRAHPRRTLTALLGLSYLGMYPLSIYDWVLRDDFYEVVQNHLSPEDLLVLQHLNGSIALDLPTYSGPRLKSTDRGSGVNGDSGRRGFTVSSDRAAVLGKDSTEECNRRLQALRNVEDVLLDVLPPRYDTRLVQLLPHLYSTPDIEIFQVDVPPSATKKLAIVLCIDNEYFKIYDDAAAHRPPRKLLSGRSAVKLRHVAAAGYSVAPVPLHEFDASKDKKAYIKHVVESILSASR